MKVIWNKKLNWDEFELLVKSSAGEDGKIRNLLVRKCVFYKVPQHIKDEQVLSQVFAEWGLEDSTFRHNEFHTGEKGKCACAKHKE